MDLSIARQTRTWSHVVASPVKCKLQQRSKGYVCERDESRLGGGRRGGGKKFILSMLNHLYPLTILYDSTTVQRVMLLLLFLFLFLFGVIGPAGTAKGGRQAR